MKKKGAEVLSVFIICTLVFCSLSFTVYAANDWGYNDSYVNSQSSENRELFFIPIAPATQYNDYMVVYWNSDYYLVCGNGNFLLYGNGGIQRPSPVICFIYEHSSNTWESCEFPRFINGDMPAFDRSMVVIDVTSNLEWWGAGSPIEEKPIINYTGYRLYWNLALIYNQVLNWVENISIQIINVPLFRYLCLTGLAGEFLIFIILILKRVGDLRSEADI